MDMETWKPIVSTNGRYMVSSIGRIKSLCRIVVGKNGKTYHFTEKMLRQSKDTTGYMRCDLSGHGTCKVHREVAIAFISNPSGLPEVNHKDGNKSNNRVENLEWITHADNTKHAHENGFVKHWNKVSDDVVRDIRREYIPHSRTKGSCALAKQYGLSPSYVWRLVVGQKRNCGRKLVK